MNETLRAQEEKNAPNDWIGIPIRLYVDDVRPIPVGWIGARSATAAVDLLCRFVVVEASLDCDLGACEECIRTRPECAATLHCEHIPDGVALVQWMVESGHWSTTTPRVHSLNPRGGAEMRRLIDAHWKPPAV